MDKYQEKYEEHQSNKTNIIENNVGDEYIYIREQQDLCVLIDIISRRRSQRIYNDKEITKFELENIKTAFNNAPTSCNRQQTYMKVIDNQWQKDRLETLLVGGKRWVNKAQLIILLFTDMLAYKSPIEKGYMPYLDIGHASQNILLMCEALNIGSCFINPNVSNWEEFNLTFNEKGLLFGGAIVIGRYDKKAFRPNKRMNDEVEI